MAMGRTGRVNVTFGGEINYTDGKRLNIMALPAGTTLTPYQTKVFYGALDHETAHLRFTNFKEVTVKREDEPVLFHLFNLVEDIRIENAQIDAYPGCRAYLDALTEYVDQQAQTSKEERAKKGQPETSMIYRELYAAYRQVDSGTVTDDLGQHPELKPIKDLLAARMPFLTSTALAEQLARDVYDLLPKGVDYAGPNPMPTSSYLSLRGLASAAIKETEVRERTEGLKQLVEQIKQDNGIKTPAGPHNLRPNPYRQKGDRILPPVDTRVFRERRSRDMVNSALEVTLDLSSSMNTTLVRQAAIISAESLAGVRGVALSVTGWTAQREYNKRKVNTDRNTGGRLDAMRFMIFKEWTEPYTKAKDRLGAIQTSGFTPLGEGYAHAYERVLQRREPRRILWLVSDGEPYFDRKDNRHSDFLLMERIHGKCKQAGIETLGLCIGRHVNLKPYVDNCIEVNDCSELPAALLALLKKTLR
jgi:hypothetical protein